MRPRPPSGLVHFLKLACERFGSDVQAVPVVEHAIGKFRFPSDRVVFHDWNVSQLIGRQGWLLANTWRQPRFARAAGIQSQYVKRGDANRSQKVSSHILSTR